MVDNHRGTHYSNNLDPALLLESARTAARCVKRMARKANKIPVLCYAGMSGVGVATAIALQLAQSRTPIRFYQVYARKEGEKHHHINEYLEDGTFGLHVEHNLNTVIDQRKPCPVPEWQNYIGVFVDDCVSTGATYRKVRGVMQEFGIPIGARFLSNDWDNGGWLERDDKGRFDW